MRVCALLLLLCRCCLHRVKVSVRIFIFLDLMMWMLLRRSLFHEVLLLLGFTLIVHDSFLFLLLSRLGQLLWLLNLHAGIGLRVKHQNCLVLLSGICLRLLLHNHLVLSIWSCLDVILLRSLLLDESQLIRRGPASGAHVHLLGLTLCGRMWDNGNFIDSLICLISLRMCISGRNNLCGLLSIAIDKLLLLGLLEVSC